MDITVHTKYGTAEQGIDALHRVVKLIDELKLIEGMEVVVTGDVFVTAAYAVPAPHTDEVPTMGDVTDS